MLELGVFGRLLEPEHDREMLVRREIATCTHEVLGDVAIEVTLAKRRRVTVVEELLAPLRADIDTWHAGLTALPRRFMATSHRALRHRWSNRHVCGDHRDHR